MTRRPPSFARRIGLMTAAVVGVALSGCGLSPLYGSAGGSQAIQTLGAVEVDPIAGQAGWLVRNALRDRIAPARARSDGPAAYRLVVLLDDNIDGFGVRTDDSVTRERRTLRARYQLVDAASGKTVLDATAQTDVGIDVVGSEFATIAAETTALERLAQQLAERIAQRISLFGRGALRSGGTAAAPATPSDTPPAPAP